MTAQRSTASIPTLAAFFFSNQRTRIIVFKFVLNSIGYIGDRRTHTHTHLPHSSICYFKCAKKCNEMNQFDSVKQFQLPEMGIDLGDNENTVESQMK